MDTSKATPGPWVISPTEYTNIVWIGPDGAKAVCLSMENALPILKAVNSYDLTIQALKDARASLFGLVGNSPNVERLDAAIALAEGPTS